MAGLLRRDPNAAEVVRRRKARILEAAAHCVQRLPLASVTLGAVARRAGVNEGLPSMYFGSLEELLVQVAVGELDAWASALVEKTGGAASDLDEAAAAALLAAGVASRPELARLLAVVPLVLEAATDAAPALQLAEGRERAVTQVAAALEARSAALASGRGRVLVERLLAAAAGLEPTAHPVGGAALAVDRDPPDLEAELAALARALLAAEGERE